MKGLISNWLGMLCSKSTPGDFYNLWTVIGDADQRCRKGKSMAGEEVLSRLRPINQNWCFCTITIYVSPYPGCQPTHPQRLRQLSFYLLFFAVDGVGEEARQAQRVVMSDHHPLLMHNNTTVPTAGTGEQFNNIHLLDRKEPPPPCLYT